MAIAKKRKVPSLIFKAVQLSMIGAILVYAFFLIDKDMLRRLDLVSYITGARILQSDSRDLLYNIATQQKFQAEITTSNLQLLPFRNPPFLALVFIPLAKLPIGLSYKILVLVNLFLLFVSALFLTKEFAKFNFSFVYGLSLLFWPAIIGILTGQISILLFILWIGIYKTLKSGNSALVGVLIALLFNKIQFVTIALFAFFLSKKKKEFTVGFMFSLMALVLVCMALIGPKGMNLYPEFISITETGIYGSNLLSQPTFLSSIFNLSKFINLSTTLIYLANLIAFLIFFVLFFRNYKKRSLKNNFCAATLFTLAFAPHAWEHDFILLLMPILYLLEVSLKTKRGASRKLPILFATFLYLSWTLRFVASPFMISFIMIGVGGIMLLHPFFLRTKEM